jgi:acetyltransferase-like isoleucine patch superfamily enzyme
MVRWLYRIYITARSAFYTLLARRIFASVGRGTVFEGHFEVPLYNEVKIGESCLISRGVSFIVTETGNIQLGSRIYIGRDCVLASDAGIVIGDNTMLAEFVSIIDSDHDTVKNGIPIRDQELIPRPVTIGADVWVGRGCAVLKGISIGEGAVVGANSVVTKDIPPFSVAYGCPARVVRYR